ncbi:MAG: flagellin [Candidatus Marinimicrobia bacterium]|jgi:flagellin|nr:flagellin [Candidatus Neomarinimicrobiota bacterium]MBT3633284.1 flagellin [Candidatus Neomarinimicrobiota bacterium]MBT3681427.1 flagellin [Candidatus Neomarinimicrobiota bacterium]MBT3758606.1 flagellin [Candidatus Neomarinimicrobiota bacterium]MBT3894740.1 flagellin [Candidatus Neomarinimicrobiota bacterium]
MAFGDLTRIGANFQSAQALHSLKSINGQIGRIQSRLSTGKRINSAEDDTAGYHVAKGLTSRVRGLGAALNNVGSAKNLLSVAEGGYQAQMDLLLNVKEKTVQAADDSLTSTQRTAIGSEITALMNEIDDIQGQTTWQGTALITANGSNASFSFHVGDGASDNLAVTLTGFDSATVGTVSVASVASAEAAITTVESAISTLASDVQAVGNYQVRLSSKEEMLSTSIANTDAARSRIEDADFAKEQMNAIKLQILQQTAVSSFAQSNSAPQIVLSLFR